MPEYIGYAGKPSYLKGTSYFDGEVSPRNGRVAYIIGMHQDETGYSRTWEVIATQSYNWGNYNILNNNGALYPGPNKKFIPKKRDMATAQKGSQTAGISDVPLLTLPQDEYPTKLEFISGGGLTRITSVNADSSIALCDADNKETRYSAGVMFTNCEHDGDTDITKHASDVEWNTFSGTALRGKTLAISIGNGDHIAQTKVKVTTATVPMSVTLTCDDKGYINFINGATSKTVLRGYTEAVYVDAKTGYKIKSVAITSGSGTLTNVSYSDTHASYNFVMGTPAADTVITATFERNIFNLIKGPSITGAGTVTGPTEAIAGDTVTVTQTPTNNEYRFDGWSIMYGNNTVNHTPSGNSTSFVMPGAETTVTAIYTKHAITWQGAAISANQSGGDVTITYKGVATDNFDRNLTYYIYRNGIKDPRDDQSHDKINPLANPPKATEQTVVMHVDIEDENKEASYSLVAENTIAVRGAIVSLHVGAVNRTVKYYKKTGKRGEWVECIPYYCVGQVVEVESSETNYTRYIRVSSKEDEHDDIVTPSWTVDVKVNQNLYTFKNNTDDVATFTITYVENNVETSETLSLDAGETQSGILYMSGKTCNSITIEAAGTGSVEIESAGFADVPQTDRIYKGIWQEIEPYYYTNNSWQLCSFGSTAVEEPEEEPAEEPQEEQNGGEE